MSISLSLSIYIYIYIHTPPTPPLCKVFGMAPSKGPIRAALRDAPACLHASEKGEVLLTGVGTLRHFFKSSVKTLLVKCPSVQWQPGGLIIHTKQWFLRAGFLVAPPISLNAVRCAPATSLETRLEGGVWHLMFCTYIIIYVYVYI